MNKAFLMIWLCILPILLAKGPEKMYVKGKNFFAEVSLNEMLLKIDLVQTVRGAILKVEISSQTFEKDERYSVFENLEELFEQLKVNQDMQISNINTLIMSVKMNYRGKDVVKKLAIPLADKNFKTQFQKVSFILLLANGINKKQQISQKISRQEERKYDKKLQQLKDSNEEFKKIIQLLKDSNQEFKKSMQALQKQISNSKVYYGQVKVTKLNIFGVNHAKVVIDYKHLNFKNPPYIFTTLVGPPNRIDTNHWRFEGINSIYQPTNTSCVIHLRQPTGGNINQRFENFQFSMQYQIKQRPN